MGTERDGLDSGHLAEVEAAISVLFDTLPELQRIPAKERKNVLQLWTLSLADMPISQIRANLVRFVRSCEGFPTIAAFRRMAGVASRPTDEDRAIAGWEQALDAIRVHGAYMSVDFEDGLINAAIHRIGGWEYLCELLTDDIPFRRKEFIEAYLSIAKTQAGDASPHIGFFDRTNGNEKYMRRIPSVYPKHEAEGKLKRPATAQEALGGVAGQRVLQGEVQQGQRRIESV